LEFKLLATFLENPEKIFTRRQLLEEVWGMSGEAQTRTVDTHIRRLREKLGPYGDAVQTVHSVGYRLRQKPPQA
jgi:two-component system phosphate regulon response regulator PhoB